MYSTSLAFEIYTADCSSTIGSAESAGFRVSQPINDTSSRLSSLDIEGVAQAVRRRSNSGSGVSLAIDDPRNAAKINRGIELPDRFPRESESQRRCQASAMVRMQSATREAIKVAGRGLDSMLGRRMD